MKQFRVNMRWLEGNTVSIDAIDDRLVAICNGSILYGNRSFRELSLASYPKRVVYLISQIIILLFGKVHRCGTGYHLVLFNL